jgi:hypothetical protein
MEADSGMQLPQNKSFCADYNRERLRTKRKATAEFRGGFLEIKLS